MSFLRPTLLGTSTPSPSHLRDTLKMVTLPPSPSPAATDSLTWPNGSRNSTMVGLLGTQQRMALTTSPTSARSMLPPNIWLTLQSLYPIGSMKPFKGQPLAMLPSLMQSRLQMIGGSRLMLCGLEVSTSASSPTRPSSTALTANSRAPSSPKTNAKEGWNACNFLSGFHIWQENRCICLPTDALEGDGRRDEDVTSKKECDVIDLTNEDSSSDDEEL